MTLMVGGNEGGVEAERVRIEILNFEGEVCNARRMAGPSVPVTPARVMFLYFDKDRIGKNLEERLNRLLAFSLGVSP